MCNGKNLRGSLSDADVVIPMMTILDEGLIETGRCQLIQQWGSGLEGVDLDAARRRGIWVANVPAQGSNADSVAEHVVLLMLALLRGFPSAMANVRAGILGGPLGKMLAGRTVCLYGLGATARALAPRLQAMGVRLIGITRDSQAAKVADFGLEMCFDTRERNEALRQTDVLVVCLRLSSETRGVVDRNALAALPSGSFVVNAARGGLIDYRALHCALETGHLGGAGLDVFWMEPISPGDPLLRIPNVIATPHIAGVTDRSYAEIADAVACNIERLRRGEPPLNRAA